MKLVSNISIGASEVIDHKNEIAIKLERICTNSGKYIKFPGFTTIYSTIVVANEKIRFISGIGVVKKTGDNVRGVFAGQRVAFCGFISGAIQESVLTTISNIAHLPSGIDMSYAAVCGYIAGAVSTINRLSPALGKIVVVMGVKKDTDIYCEILHAFGCKSLTINSGDFFSDKDHAFYETVMYATGGKGADACIILKDQTVSGDDITRLGSLCHYQGYVILAGADSISGGRVSTSCQLVFANDTGMGALDQEYMNSRYSYPHPYVQRTTTANMSLALQLIASNKLRLNEIIKTTKGGLSDCLCSDEENRNDLHVVLLDGEQISIEPDSNDTLQNAENENNTLTNKNSGIHVPQHIGQIAAHIKTRNYPCILQVTYKCSEITHEVVENAVIQASYIVGCRVIQVEKISKYGDLKTAVICYSDGSVVSLHFVSGFIGHTHERLELHYDGMTVICCNRKELILYSKDKSVHLSITETGTMPLISYIESECAKRVVQEIVDSWEQAANTLAE